MIENLINNLKMLKQSLETNLDQSVSANLSNMADMQRERLNKGEDADGGLLKRNEGFYPYSPQYTKYKRAKGGQVRFVDLKLNGNYQAGITATRVGKGKVNLHSKDKKEAFLPSQYDKIYGFSPAQENKLNDLFVPELIRVAKQKITNRR